MRSLGPGLLLAAAGIGAGDVVVASVTGIKFGTTLLWAVVFTAALKFVLTEALARWQLATGETVVRAWITRLPRWVGIYFAGYLVLWTFLVGASLSSACGLAGASLFPGLSVPVWGAIHAVVAALLVGLNRYAQFQRVMKGLIAIMALCVLVCAVLSKPSVTDVASGLLIPRVPAEGGGAAVLALLGGIGGSLTVICYGYWMRATGWSGAERLPQVRADVRLAYVFTGLFGIALVIIAAGVHANAIGGTRIALEVAARLESSAGPAGRWMFLFGFWCTVFTAMLGVWQGVSQVYVDLFAAWRRQPAVASNAEGRQSPVFIGALCYIAIPPLVLLWFKQPVAVVVTFSVVGAFFMPFLAGTLLYLNNRRDWVGSLANRKLGNAALIVCLLVFGAVCVRELWSVF
ncbi:Nramp family divalent metal transporter [Oleiharenicola lentus]|uniref:Nramp family divalent metal transporter n=1 Tax=Oleiharenicola lentus TaxID=2508720 RepID=UPI003F6720E2